MVERFSLQQSLAMGLDRCLVFRLRHNSFLINAEGCGIRRNSLVQPRRLMSCGILCATTARGNFGDRILRGFSSGLVLLDSGFLNCKGRTRDGCLISHYVRRDGFIKSAMSDDGAQMARENSRVTATSSKYPCMYVKRSVSSGEVIQYPGTVVVLGDVQEGGAIMADGDIVVLGHIHGDVHGGQNGDKGAVVYATQLDASHIRIAGATALVSKLQFPGCSVIASLQEDGTLGIRAVIQEFDDKEASISSELHSAAMVESLKTSKGSESKDQASSKRPAQLALFTGVYISLVGMALLVFPTSLFGVLFDVRSVTVGWIRVGGILAVVFGVYYIGTAVGDMRESSGARAFYMSTVVGRVFLFFGFCWLVAVGAAQRALLLVGVVNMLGAMSMLVALRQESRVNVLKT